jgi:hypothetical protein
MPDEIHELKIKVIEVNNLVFPKELIDFVLCQFSLSLERKPYIVNKKIDSLWNRLKEAIIFSGANKSTFFLAPEYTLPFIKARQLIKLIEIEAPNNSVYCIPVEHLNLKQLRKLSELLRIPPENLNSNFSPDFAKVDKWNPLIFNIAIIAIKDELGNLNFHLQPKNFPANFEEDQHLQPNSFKGGQVVNVFKTPQLSFAIMICFDFIASDRKLPEKIIKYLNQPGNYLDFLFILQVNPKPLHREFERGLQHFANDKACRYTSIFFVNCDSTSHLEDSEGEMITGFNKTAVLGKFRLSSNSEYKVDKTIEIPPDNNLGIEILQLDKMYRLMLTGKGERIVLLRTNALRNPQEGPTYPRENNIHIYTYKGKSLTRIKVITTYEHTPIQSLPDIPKCSFRPITILKPPVFFGRSKEISDIMKFLYEEKGCLLIYGGAGIGKSSLVQEAAFSALNDQKQFSAGLWFTSKDSHLSLRRFFSDIAINLAHPNLQQLDEINQKKEIIKYLRQELKGTSIIIFDNIETIRDDDMISFIGELSNYSKVIVTSRNPDVKISCSKYELKPMKNEDMKQLAQNRWRDINDIFLSRILDCIHGSPFAFKILSGYCLYEKNLDPIITDIELSGVDVINWSFQKVRNSIDSKGQMVINSLQLFADSFTKETVKIITDISEEDIDELFQEFENRSFIEKILYPDSPNFRYQIHPLVRKFSEEIEPDTPIENRYIDFYKQFVKEHCEAENFKKIEQEIRNIEKALEICVKKSKLKIYLKIISLLYNYYYERGFWNNAIEQCIKGYNYAKKLGNSRYSIEMSSHASWCAFRKEEYIKANEWLDIAKKESKKSKRLPPQLEGLIEETEALIYLFDGKFNIKEAQESIEKAIERYKLSNSSEAITLQSRSLSYLGELFLRQREYQKAIDKFTEVNQLIDKYKDEKFARKIIAWTQGNLGEAMIMKCKLYPKNTRKEYLEICVDRFKVGMDIARKIERQHTIAQCCLGLGVALLYIGRIEEGNIGRIEDGKKYITWARDIYRRLGKKSKLSYIDTLLERINQNESLNADESSIYA